MYCPPTHIDSSAEIDENRPESPKFAFQVVSENIQNAPEERRIDPLYTCFQPPVRINNTQQQAQEDNP